MSTDDRSSVKPLKFVAVIIAAASLNIGLYIILYFIAPLIAGIISGFILKEFKESILAGYFGSLLAYIPLFVYLELIISGNPSDFITILFAAGIISLLGGIGGVFGSLVRKKTN